MAEILQTWFTGYVTFIKTWVKSAPNFSNFSCSVESGRWTNAIQMFDRLRGPINIVTLERFAPAGNTVSRCIYQGASHQGRLSQTGFVLLRVQFVWTLSQLRKSLWGLLFCWGSALKRLVMLSLPLAVRREKQCEGSLSISETSSNSYAQTDFLVKSLC